MTTTNIEDTNGVPSFRDGSGIGRDIGVHWSADHRTNIAPTRVKLLVRALLLVTLTSVLKGDS